MLQLTSREYQSGERHAQRRVAAMLPSRRTQLPTGILPALVQTENRLSAGFCKKLSRLAISGSLLGDRGDYRRGAVRVVSLSAVRRRERGSRRWTRISVGGLLTLRRTRDCLTVHLRSRMLGRMDAFNTVADLIGNLRCRRCGRGRTVRQCEARQADRSRRHAGNDGHDAREQSRPASIAFGKSAP